MESGGLKVGGLMLWCLDVLKLLSYLKNPKIYILIHKVNYDPMDQFISYHLKISKHYQSNSVSSNMKFILYTSFLLILSCSSTFQEEISSYVINGEDARIEEHPYMAHVYSLMLPTCGGSILTRRSVLTVKKSAFIS